MSTSSRRRAPLAGCLALVATLAAPGAFADEWLVYLGGGVEAIEGGWTEKRGRVIFTKAGGTLMSVPFDEVDLAASTFITWQLDGRRNLPPRAAVEKSPPPADGDGVPTCAAAKVVGLLGGESLEVASGEAREIVHVSCLDTPETRHRFPSLGWFGRATMSVLETVVPAGAEVCLAEESPPRRDGEGHRILYVSLADGRDLATLVIDSGFGLLRPGECRDGARYRAAEDRAIERQAGLWGRRAGPAAFEAVRVGAASVPPGSRRAVSGCRLRR